jgi:Spy/CpxP family protein refolding chaperone
MMMRPGGDPTGLMLLTRPDVQKELNLTDDQKTKLTAMQQKLMSDFMDLRQNSNGDREAMQAGFKKLGEQAQKDAAAILTKDQMARLKEVNIQLAGFGAAAWADVQKDLGLTADQIAKIKDLQAKQQEANRGLFQNQDMTMEEKQEAFKKNGDALNVEIGKVLTEPQKAKLKTMGGKEFKAEKDGG